VVLTNADGKNITINSETTAVGTGTAATTGPTAGLNIAVGTSGAVLRGQVTIEALEDITIGGDDPTVAGFDDGQLAAATGNLSSLSVTDVANANDAIKRIDSALQTVNSFRSELGAVQNRFESTIANLSTSVEN